MLSYFPDVRSAPLHRFPEDLLLGGSERGPHVSCRHCPVHLSPAHPRSPPLQPPAPSWRPGRQPGNWEKPCPACARLAGGRHPTRRSLLTGTQQAGRAGCPAVPCRVTSVFKMGRVASDGCHGAAWVTGAQRGRARGGPALARCPCAPRCSPSHGAWELSTAGSTERHAS